MWLKVVSLCQVGWRVGLVGAAGTGDTDLLVLNPFRGGPIMALAAFIQGISGGEFV
jgi:hypothetical protein